MFSHHYNVISKNIHKVNRRPWIYSYNKKFLSKSACGQIAF